MLGYGDMIKGGMKWDMLTWDMKFRDMFWVMIGICWGYDFGLCWDMNGDMSWDMI